MRRNASFLSLLAVAVAATAALPAFAGDATRDKDAPVVRRTAQGGEMVKVPEHLHHTLTATVDAQGKLKYECKQGHAAGANAAAK